MYSPFPSDLVPREQKEDEFYGLQYALAIKGAWDSGGVSPVSPADRPWYELLHLYYIGRQPVDQYVAQYRGWGTLTSRQNPGAVSMNPRDAVGITPDIADFYRKGLNNINFNDVVSPAPKQFGAIRALLNEADGMVDIDSISPDAMRKKEELKWRKYNTGKYLPELLQTGGVPMLSKPDWSPRNPEELELYEKFHGIKLQFEVGLKKIADHGLAISQWDDTFENWKASLIKYNFICGRVAVNAEGAVGIEYIDPSDYITAYLDKQPQEEPPYAGHIVRRKIGDIAPILREKYGLTDDQLLSLAKRVATRNGYSDPETFDYGITEPVTRRYLWYDWWVPVLCFEYKTVDEERRAKYTNSEGKTVYRPLRVHHKTEGVMVKGKEKVINKYYYNTKNDRSADQEILADPTVYEGEWVIDTDYFLSYGRARNILKNSDGSAALSYFHVHVAGQSLCERSKPLLDAYMMDWLKLQASCLEASPDGFIIDQGVIANMNLGFGDLNPLQLRRVKKETGDIYVLTTAEMMRNRISAKDAIVPIQGGPGAQVDSWLSLMKYRLDTISDLTGLTAAAEARSGQKPELVGLMQGELIATSNALYPQKRALMTLKETAIRKLVAKARVLIEFSTKSRNYYAGVIGQKFVDDILQFKELSMNQLGIRMRIAPTQERKNSIREAALMALNSGRNGVPIIDFDDFLLIDKALEDGLVEYAAWYFSITKYRRLEQQAKEQQASIQANAQAQMQSAQAAEEAKRQTMALVEQMKSNTQLQIEAQKIEGDVLLEDVKHKHRMAELMLEGSIEARNNVEVKGEI